MVKFLKEQKRIHKNLEWIMIDSTIVRANMCVAGYGKNSQEQEALGRRKGGLTTKIHIATDGLSNPLKFIIIPGQQHDICQATELCKPFSNAVVLFHCSTWLR